MKSRKYTFKAVLLFALALTLVQCKVEKSQTESGSNRVNDSCNYQTLPIAYINTDSLLSKYNYAKDVTDALLRKAENSRASMNEKARKFEADVTEFQRKVKNNGFFSQDRYEQEQMRLQKSQQELQELEQRLNNEFMAEQQKTNAQLIDSIQAFLKEYNMEKKYEVIFSNTSGDNILIAQPKYDITNEIVDLLNKRYKSKQ